jgi:hypothetical protein
MRDAGKGIHLHHQSGDKEHDKDDCHGGEGIIERLQEQIEYHQILCLKFSGGYFIIFGYLSGQIYYPADHEQIETI